MKFMNAKRVVVFTDSSIAKLPSMERVVESLSRNDLAVDVYDSVRIEPNDASFRHAASYLSSLPGPPHDAVVALGGGSVIDTAKAANLYASRPPPDDFYDYVNPPVGQGLPIPGPLPPLIAIPTTAGTGSETTGVAIFDDAPSKSKTGIASRLLKPHLGIVDPDNTETLPRTVATYSGLDVICHAVESYTALPFDRRPKPKAPQYRPAYQGSNPISDIWSLASLRAAAKYLPRAVADPSDVVARTEMLLASAYAGIGFGNAGVHLCHGMSYPVASQVKTYKPKEGYDDVDHPLVPHGHSVVVNAPAVFRFTGTANPERHMECADILAAARRGGDATTVAAGNTGSGRPGPEDAGRYLADEMRELMIALDVPLGLRALGYDERDVDGLVEGTLPQHRVTKISPRPVGREELTRLFLDALGD